MTDTGFVLCQGLVCSTEPCGTVVTKADDPPSLAAYIQAQGKVAEYVEKQVTMCCSVWS